GFALSSSTRRRASASWPSPRSATQASQSADPGRDRGCRWDVTRGERTSPPHVARATNLPDVTPPADTEFRLRDIWWVAYGPSVVSSVGHGAVMPVLALRARDLGADVATAAAVVAVLSLGMLAASLPAGALVARI